MSKLTKRQSEILAFLKTWIEDNGYPPTRAEMAKELGFKSPNAAGEPILAQQHIESTCPVTPDLFKPRADYLLQVRGMSMKDVGILDGDLLAVHITQEAHNGQIVVARLDDDVTVKRYKREGSTVWLLPENTDFEPIVVDLKTQELIIEGLSVGVIRR